MKILQTGIDPKQVVAMIYQHYDPDLCGSMPNFIDMFDNPALQIISEKKNNPFISFYISRDKCNLLESIDAFDYRFDLNGRILEFIPTPYTHSPGSFVTYDTATKTLFSSDLFGSYATQWDLFLDLRKECFTCEDHENCPNNLAQCPVEELLAFHREIMPCSKALRYAMERITAFEMDRIAPQHGSVIDNAKDISFFIQKLKSLTDVGIDAL
jgi:flavorubredoxin